MQRRFRFLLTTIFRWSVQIRFKLGIHERSNPFHLAQRSLRFPPIQVDRFRQVIQGCSKAPYSLLRSPYFSSRQTDSHPISPSPTWGISEVQREHSPLPAMISPV
ncbi:hypothetical protein AVEN_86586-1 [Araneus ventricosus]|uniref:Uncharacterized protein n=1 Tax=Araneus ventricosus TaxID=182803 RepID=A0A4Y2BIQ5_ARAVE|nr:hypothetical protein AVEN_86586-1 [Araneus ventricosus]